MVLAEHHPSMKEWEGASVPLVSCAPRDFVRAGMVVEIGRRQWAMQRGAVCLPQMQTVDGVDGDHVSCLSVKLKLPAVSRRGYDRN